MPKVSSPQSADAKEPFLVRSHHLAKLVELTELASEENDDPGGREEAAYRLAKFFADRMAKEARVEKPNDTVSEKDIAYAIDVVGSDGEGRRKVLEGDGTFYLDFLELPPDYPVRIQSSIRDRMCQACVIGDHCSVGNPYFDNIHLNRLKLWGDAAGIDVQTPYKVDPNEKALPKNKAIDIEAGKLREVLKYVVSQKKPDHPLASKTWDVGPE